MGIKIVTSEEMVNIESTVDFTDSCLVVSSQQVDKILPGSFY